MRWSKALASPDGNLAVSFPDIRCAIVCPINHGVSFNLTDIHSWASLRATEGWAILQHHAVLRSTLTVLPPRFDSKQQTPDVPKILVQLERGSFFTIVPADVEWEQRRDFVPEWYSGNIYEVDGAPAHLVKLPTAPSASHPTVYHLYVSGDYEVLGLHPRRSLIRR